MKDEDRMKDQLIDELVKLRREIAELRAAEAEHKRFEEMRPLKIGEILIEMGHSTRSQLERTLQLQEEFDISKPLGEIMVEAGVITREQLCSALEEQKIRLLHQADGIIHQDDIVKYVTQTTAEIFGYTTEEIMNWKLDEFVKIVHPDDAAFVMKRMQEKGNKDSVSNYSYRIITKTGKMKWIDQYSTIILYNGRDAELITVTDVTVRKKVEEIVRESERKYHQAVEKQLRSSGQLASMERLASILTHELNNPLDGVLRYVRLLLKQTPTDDPRRIYAEQAQDGVIRVSNMVRGLLDFTRKAESSFTSIDIERSIRQCLFLFRVQTSAQNIKIRTEFGKNITTSLNADVEQIFMNIIENAIQAMTNGGTLSISTNMLSPQLFEARFSDTGEGIPDEIQEKIFDLFFTTKNTTSDIGLGLSISQEIAERYSGSISVESQLGKGTTFVVRLPTSDAGPDVHKP